MIDDDDISTYNMKGNIHSYTNHSKHTPTHTHSYTFTHMHLNLLRRIPDDLMCLH